MAKNKRIKGLGPRGWHRVNVGKVKTPGVDALKPKRFYTSTIPAEHEAKTAIIRLRWKLLQKEGHEYWPQVELDKLVEDGLVRSGGEVTSAIGLAAILNEEKEPLTDTELAPFRGEDGLLTPQAAVTANDLMLRKVFTRLDIRSAFFRQIYKDALANPKETFEWCCRVLGWTKDAAAKFLFNVEGNMNIDPIAFDASAELPKAAKTETKEMGIDDGGVFIDVTDSDSRRG